MNSDVLIFRTSLGITLAALLAAALPARAQFNPVALTPGSYTYDIVVEASAAQALPYCINVTAGSGADEGDNTFYEQGFYSRLGLSGGNSGIPRHNTTFHALNNANITFLMPPDYTTNNELMIDPTYGNGELLFDAASSATNLVLLCTSGSGTTEVDYVVTHSDSSTDSGTFAAPDWFAGGDSVSWGANGRVTADGTYSVYSLGAANTSTPYLYAVSIPVSGASPIVNISFDYDSGGHANIYAVSGNDGGSKWAPIAVSGFNVMGTVPAAFPLTATMDQGTNLANNGNLATWFEQGYYQDDPSTGLPPSGSVFTSQTQPTHSYQMGNYSTNNAALLDAHHKTANLTPASPATYSEFALLTAGGNIGAGNKMTNYCILQHADGRNETNLFIGYDWFETGVPNAVAYVANGRVNMYNRTLNNLEAGFPELFESYFPVNDVASPVTNILLRNVSQPAATATTYVMAVSATGGGVPPVLGADPAGETVFPGQTASFAATVEGGTAPITYSWLVDEGGGNFAPLSDGLDANGSTISGSSTLTLTISNVTDADGTDYEFMAVNAEGQAVSDPVVLTVDDNTPIAPEIGDQSPNVSPVSVFSNSVTTFSVTLGDTSTPVYTYQWCTGDPYGSFVAIAGATNDSFPHTNLFSQTVFCIVSNFVGTAVSAPVEVDLVAPSTYIAAILPYHPAAYWPLNETGGATAFDYTGNNPGTYMGNYLLGEPGLPATAGMGATTSVNFDGSSAYVDIPIGDLNITGPISVIEWIQCSLPSQFCTSLGHTDNGYRFDMDTNGFAHFADQGPDVVEHVDIADGNWHQLVGVYDGVYQYFYVDNVPVTTGVKSTPTGSFDDLFIGGDPEYAGQRNFAGNVAQVAILTNALSRQEVADIYFAVEAPPTVTITPSSPTVFDGASITLTAITNGPPPIALQWYVIDSQNDSNLIAGATGESYTVTNATLAMNGYTFGAIAKNAYGATAGGTILTVESAPASIASGGDIAPLNSEVYAGAPVIYRVVAAGSAPISYQWLFDNTNVTGATNAIFQFTASCGTHSVQATVANSQNGGNPAYSSQASLTADAAPSAVTFNSDGTGWQLNTIGAGNVPTITAGVLELTDGGGAEASSAFYGIGESLESFAATFTYTAQNPQADGATFSLQDSAGGIGALGAGGGGLGYSGISNSLALEINLYELQGIAVESNGITYGSDDGAAYTSTGAVSVASGDPINFVLTYAGGTLSVALTDQATASSYTTNYYLGAISNYLGATDLGYVGFSGGTGSLVSVQQISGFSFTPVFSLPAVEIAAGSHGQLLLSWPGSASAYHMEQSSDLRNWSSGPVGALVSERYQASVSLPATGAMFYRLAWGGCQ